MKIEDKYDQSMEVIVGLSNDIQELKSKCIEWSAKYGEAQKEINRLKAEKIQLRDRCVTYLGELVLKTHNEKMKERYEKRIDELMR